MRPYPHRLRQRIVRAVDAGMTQAAAAQQFGVGRATVQRYVEQHHRLVGDPGPRDTRGRPRLIGPTQVGALWAQLEAAPEAPLNEHCARWANDHGQRISVATLQRTIARLGWPRKRARVRRPDRPR
jgi:transposase